MPKLTAPKFAAEIKAGNIAPVYYFTGDDVYRKLEFEKQIRAALAPDEFNFMRVDGSGDIAGLLTAANTAPVFSARRMIVLNNADKIRKGANAAAALAQYLANPLESTCLIVLHNDSKKSKKDKTFEDALAACAVAADFAPLAGAQLFAWLRDKFAERGLKAETAALEMLEETAGGDLTALSAEIEKLSLYLADRADKTVGAADVLASIGFSKEENPFALSNAVMNCDGAQSLRLAGVMLAAGEEPVSILNKISACAVKMLRIRRLAAAGLNQYEITQAAGLLPWEGRLVSAAPRYPVLKTLQRALDKIIEADMTLKSSGSGDPEILIKGVILTLLGR
ncbi:MAG: DNA polymerase III subunit delta [Elusimicrobiota bacterium]|jgi:DNA polymerase-3 subunit delta|nr:DNA polymerase III subunit delta [Elusimicrobiota bacterium]